MQTKRAAISQTLMEFYERPVASVSMELLFSLFAVIFLSILAIKPTILTISELIKEIDDKKLLSQQLNQKVAALQTAQELYESNQTKFVTLDEALPSTPQLGNAIIILEKLAQENSLVIEALSTSQIPKETTPPPGAPLSQQNTLINMSVTGTFPQIRQYIESLRLIRRTFVIDGVSFNLKESAGKSTLSASFTVNMLYLSAGEGGAGSSDMGAGGDGMSDTAPDTAAPQ